MSTTRSEFDNDADTATTNNYVETQTTVAPSWACYELIPSTPVSQTNPPQLNTIVVDCTPQPLYNSVEAGLLSGFSNMAMTHTNRNELCPTDINPFPKDSFLVKKFGGKVGGECTIYYTAPNGVVINPAATAIINSEVQKYRISDGGTWAPKHTPPSLSSPPPSTQPQHNSNSEGMMIAFMVGIPGAVALLVFIALLLTRARKAMNSTNQHQEANVNTALLESGTLAGGPVRMFAHTPTPFGDTPTPGALPTP